MSRDHSVIFETAPKNNISYCTALHAKMGTIKDQDGVEPTEAKDIKKRWQEHTELYKKDLNQPDNHDGVITYLEPDILECKAKWALGSILQTKLAKVMEFQLSYFKS